MNIITELFQNLLAFLVLTTGNLGLAIITFTFLIRSALIPLTLPSLRSGQKIRELQPEIKKLQKKHKDDKQAMQQAQMELYKKYNVNPLAGCIPQLIQIGLLIVLYQVLITFLKHPQLEGITVVTQFLWLDLIHPDKTLVLPILAAVSQLVLSLMIVPATETPDVVPNNSKNKKIQEENTKEETVADMAQTMQQQMLFIMPIMTGFIAVNFPSGLAVYWIITTVFSIGQQWYISGWGGIPLYYQRVQTFITTKLKAV